MSALEWGRGVRYNLRSLQVFEAVARHTKLSDAASELGVTQGAVSQQIHRLSEDLGEVLFVRSGRNLVLTDRGQKLANTLKRAFKDIDNSFNDSIGFYRETIKVSCCSAVFMSSIIYKVLDNLKMEERIDLHLNMTSGQPFFSETEGDIFISTVPAPPGYWSRKIMDEHVLPVFMNEQLAGRFWEGHLPLISTELESGVFGIDWQKWSGETGKDLIQLNTGRFLRSSHFMVSYGMAMRGAGVALVPDFLIDCAKNDLACHALQDFRVNSGRAYYISTKRSRRYEERINQLINAISIAFRRKQAPLLPHRG